MVVGMLKLKVSAEEMCAICVMGWPGPIPPFQGVQGVLPYGVKNVIKWKSRMGLKKLVNRQYEKLKKEKIWGTKEYNGMVMSFLFYNQAYTFAGPQDNFITFYEGTESNFASIGTLDNKEYEIVCYANLEEWIKAIVQNYHIIMADTSATSFTVIHHRWGINKEEIHDVCNVSDWDIRIFKYNESDKNIN